MTFLNKTNPRDSSADTLGVGELIFAANVLFLLVVSLLVQSAGPVYIAVFWILEHLVSGNTRYLNGKLRNFRPIVYIAVPWLAFFSLSDAWAVAQLPYTPLYSAMLGITIAVPYGLWIWKVNGFLFRDKDLFLAVYSPRLQSIFASSVNIVLIFVYLVTEEVFYRYFIIHVISSPGLGLAVSIMLFVSGHACKPWAIKTYTARDIATQFIFAAISGMIFLYTGSLYGPILLHLAHNSLHIFLSVNFVVIQRRLKRGSSW